MWRVALTPLGVTGLDHVAVGELHGLGTLGTELAGHDHLCALGTLLHDVAQHTVARAAHGQAAQQLVPGSDTITHHHASVPSRLEIVQVVVNSVFAEVREKACRLQGSHHIPGPYSRGQIWVLT